MAWKAVLFDMDGVLIDSEEYMAKTGVRALKKYGIDAKESDFAEFVGCGENRYVGGVAEKYGVPYRTEMKEYLYACYGEHVKEEANIPDGVLDVLHTLRSRGYKLAVCSSADRVKVLMNLGAIGAEQTLFDHLVTGTDIKNPKPDLPDGRGQPGPCPGRVHRGGGCAERHPRRPRRRDPGHRPCHQLPGRIPARAGPARLPAAGSQIDPDHAVSLKKSPFCLRRRGIFCVIPRNCARP